MLPSNHYINLKGGLDESSPYINPLKKGDDSIFYP